MPQFIEMILNETTTIYQVIETKTVEIRVEEVSGYVDQNGDPVALPDVYEMRPVTGEVLDTLP
jgi:hypothetical protein